MRAVNLRHGRSHMANILKSSPFFLLMIFILTASVRVGFAQSVRTFQKGDYAEYGITAAFIEFSNYTMINQPSHEYLKGTLRWTVTDSNGSELVITLALKISYLDYTTTVSVDNRKTYLENRTEWGYFPFWVDNASMDKDLNISGKGPSLSAGRVDQENILKNTPQGWQSCYYVSASSNPTVFNRTLMPYYYYDMNTGILVAMSADDPIWTVLGPFTIAGDVTLQSTNVNLGPQNYAFILFSLIDFWPIIFLIAVFFVAYYLYRRKTRGKRKSPGQKKGG